MRRQRKPPGRPRPSWGIFLPHGPGHYKTRSMKNGPTGPRLASVFRLPFFVSRRKDNVVLQSRLICGTLYMSFLRNGLPLLLCAVARPHSFRKGSFSLCALRRHSPGGVGFYIQENRKGDGFRFLYLFSGEWAAGRGIFPAGRGCGAWICRVCKPYAEGSSGGGALCRLWRFWMAR